MASVNMVNPGATATPRMERQARRVSELNGKSVDEVKAEHLAGILFGRFVTADDMARGVLPSSRTSHNVTGNSSTLTAKSVRSFSPSREIWPHRLYRSP